MRKSKEDVEDEFGDLHMFGDDEGPGDLDTGQRAAQSEREDRERLRPARQRVELRNEQRSLRQELSDWDDYGED